MTVENLVSYIKSHPCYTHPIFENWARVQPEKKVVGALFHQIRSFCDSTRPVHNLPEGLIRNGLGKESSLVMGIAESEENHGPELATMAGYIINKMSDTPDFPDLYDQSTIEASLKENSDEILGNLPGYDKKTGLLVQNKIARNVFEDRKRTDKDTVLKNLGVTLALEIISNRQLIPGEKLCLVDSKIYGVSLDDEEMHYLAEHWGEAGAEAAHEDAAKGAISAVLSPENEKLVYEGARNFLDSLLSLWDVLNSTLLGSGYLYKNAA
jgi:hypothetical protein